ncbi:MAG: tetratricopeptide repeat protein [Proteobacteria bacterium]|nr:tetratricopeptide repeat protein [Pseudomonadota bacterium]
MTHKKQTVAQKGPSEDTADASVYYYYLESEIHKQKGNIEKAIDFMDKTVSLDPDSIFLKKEQALLFLMANRTDKAVQLLELIVDRDPEDVESLIMLGRVKQLLNHDNKEIIDIYNTVLDIDPEQQNIYLLLGNIYLDHSEFENALAIFERLVDRFPDSYAGYFYIGEIYKEQKKNKEAESAFLKSIEIEPELIESRFEMIKLFPNDKKKVSQLYKDVLKIDPGNIEAQTELGLIYDQSRNQEKASQIFQMLSESNMKDTNVLLKIVKLLLDNERYDDMLIVLGGMTKASKENSDIHYFLGMANDKLKNYEAAISHFNKIDVKSEFYVKSVLHTSFMYHEMGNTDKAIDILETALALHPEDSELIGYLGSFYEEIGKFTDAERTLKKGLEIDPNNPIMHFYLGVLYDKMGNADHSLKEMKTVILLDPKNSNALNYLGYTYADQGINLDEAEQLIIKALLYKPNDGYITDSLGWVYYKKGHFEKAISYLEKAVSLVPNDPLILEHLGDAYSKSHQPDKAIKCYTQSLEFNHKNPELIQTKLKQLTQETPSPE